MQNPSLSISESRASLEAFHGGDRAALERLVVQHLPALLAYVRLNGSPLLAARESDSDVLQSACREILGDLGRFEYRSEGHFRNWLYTATLRKIRDKLRYWQADKRSPVHEVHVDRPAAADSTGCPTPILEIYANACSPSQDAVVREELTAFERAFAQLPEEGRTVILMSRVCGMTHAEIAGEIGKSEAATRQTYARATARLVGLLQPP